MKDQKDSEEKTPQYSPTFLSVTTFTPQLPVSSIKQFIKSSSETPTKEENKSETLAMLLGHESSESLEDID